MNNKITDGRRGFFMIDNTIVDDYHLTPFEMAVYVVIVRIADRATSKAFPSFATVAKIAGISRAKTITVISELEKKGLLSVTPRKESGGKESKSNLYTIQEVGSDKTSSDYAQGSPQDRLPVVHGVDYPSPDGGPQVVHEVDSINTKLNNTKDPGEPGPESEQPVSGEPNDPISSETAEDDTSHKAVYGAAMEVWPDLDANWRGRIVNQLRGQSHRQGDQQYDISPPMSGLEVQAFGVWYHAISRAEMVTANHTISRWVKKFRVATEYNRYLREAEALRSPAARPEPTAHEQVMGDLLSALEEAPHGS